MMGSQLQAWRTAQRSQSIDRAWKILTIALTLLLLTTTVPACVDASSFGTTPSEPERMLLPTTCTPPKLAGPPQFLSLPKGTAKYPFSGVCTSPERPGDQIHYRLEGSWHGHRLHDYYRPPGPVVGVAVNHSFFLNWAYWRLYRRSMGNEYWEYLRAAYSSPEIWAEHASELEALADYVEELRASLCVAVWPELTNVRQSREVTDKVVRFFRERGSAVVDLAEAFEDTPSAELRVNDLDGHPNVSTHRRAALLIHKKLVELGATAGTSDGPASTSRRPR